MRICHPALPRGEWSADHRIGTHRLFPANLAESMFGAPWDDLFFSSFFSVFDVESVVYARGCSSSFRHHPLRPAAPETLTQFPSRREFQQ
jgi:hypothetical protein